MPRGTPDYDNPEYALAAKISDPSMLALGTFGFCPIDSLGRWVWYDNFRNGLNAWYIGENGDGEVPYLSTDYPYVSPAAVMLPSGAVLADESYLFRYTYYSDEPGTLGFEFSVRDHGNAGKIACYLTYSAAGGSNRYRMGIRINWSAQTLSFVDNTGEVNVTMSADTWGDSIWFPIKIVGDFSTGYYKRLMIGDRFIDLSDYQMEEPVAAVSEAIVLYIASISLGVASKSVHLGHVLITTDEP